MSAVQSSSNDSTTVESAWAELNLHLQRSKGLCLVFLCSDSPAALNLLRTRVEDAWAWRTAPMAWLHPAQPGTAALRKLKSG